MYAAIAGLRTHMQNLNVIGNNVANVNTQSYKSARSVFKTAIYTTLSGGSDGTQVVGGANPSQIGYGSNMASVGIDMSTGNYAVTGNATDMMLDGDGFFLMGNKDVADTFNGSNGDVSKLTSLTLTRLGNFGFKADGYLTNDDLCVYGFMCIGVWGDDAHPLEIEGENGATTPAPGSLGKKAGDPIFSDQLVPIRFPGVRMTERYYDEEGVELAGQDLATAQGLNATQLAARGWTVQEVGEIMYATTGSDGIGKLQDAYYYVDPATGEAVEPGADGTLPEGAVKTLYSKAQFTGITVDQKTGLITGTSNETNEVVTIGCVAVGQVTNPNGVTQIGNSYYNAGAGSGDLTISVLGGGASALGINYVNGELTRARAQAEAGTGGADGTGGTGGDTNTVEVEYAEGMRIRNGGKTKILSNGLEMSKTDLAQEISNMILTQRGYQANTRIITVTDSMLEELVNMKR